jgi:ABC-type antimicrobial peptide transport system permease subunit
MTPKRRKILSMIGIFILGVIIGGIIGSYAASHFLGSFFSYGSNLTNMVAIKQNVYTLNKLREGKIDKAIEHLEIILDGDLISYSADIHGSENMKKDIRTALKTAKDYRLKFPRATNHPEIDKAVAKALSEADN